MTDDLPYFDGLENVQLTIGANVHAAEALRRPLAPRLEAGAQIDRAAWHVAAAAFSGEIPTVGSTLEAGAEQWTVIEMVQLSFGTRFRLLCERMA